ncbi:hypothetical protein BGX27_009392 [Mortierella sp. AM989]|nr:hypothetical protein BGX27_009392 [Mortierella sp. AM989]
MSATTIQPFDLPEIRNALALFLNRRELLQCVRVNKSWHASFSPYIWSEIEFRRNESAIALMVLEKHRHLVKKITSICSIPPEHTEIHFPNLCSLRFTVLPFATQELFLLILDSHRQSITKLDLVIQDTTILPELWELVLELQGLKDLTVIENLKGNSKPLPRFWEICPRLESLVINEGFLPEAPYPDPSTTAFLRIRRLRIELNPSKELGHMVNGQVDLLACFPNLVTLEWIANGVHETVRIDGFSERMASGTWPQLLHLSVSRCYASDEDLALIISNMSQVQTLGVPFADFGPLALKALRPHFRYLRDLNISYLPTSGSTIIEILTSCPHLRSFSADILAAQDVLNSGPWVCKESLKSLELFFEISPLCSEDEQQQQQLLILERLSELKNLERLDLTNKLSLETDLPKTLDLRLEKGLGRLATLKHIREFTFYNTPQYMSYREIYWMVEYWEDLQKIGGNLCEDEAVAVKLQLLLFNNGIVSYCD